MSPNTTSPPQEDEQVAMSMPSSPFHEVPLDAALTTHGNETLPILQTPLRQSRHSPLSPADCRTLEKILEDVRSPSPLASRERNQSLLSVDSVQDGSSDTGIEDMVQYTDDQHDYCEDADEGYEDEDNSMDLSDTVDEGFEDGDGMHGEDDGECESILPADDDEPEYVWSDGDTIEDIMNMPGKSAPPARQQGLSGIHVHDPSTSEENKGIRLWRACLERALFRERIDQERQGTMSAGSDRVNLDAAETKDEDDAVDLSDDPEIRAIQDIQAIRSRTDMSALEEDMDGELELEDIEPTNRRTTRLFSPTPISRRASANPLKASSSIKSPDSRPTVESTPSGRHLKFTPYATIPGTLLTKTLNYDKQYKGKENSPTKNRRNASLPEEIAELAREAKEEEDLDAYREMDLAPMEPVMESDTAGDLITFGTPLKSNISTTAIGPTTPDIFAQRTPITTRLSLGLGEGMGMSESVEDSSAGMHALPGKTAASGTWSPVGHEGDNEDTETLDVVPDEEDRGDQDKQMILYPQHPTFVNVIGMLPQTIFWVTVAPIAKYSTQAYEALVEKLKELKL